ncbi:hypothetical protein DJ568_04385 [Mucilaginibacter hurinus]|uniref:DUF4412 domain-containing protein n=1 Tax=Mucilaginibacter hurinus TaxID=2201324 RepID=A0A367GRB4_9SPHI|nr:hypothetical protein [Mucilaginibacter hurinus]RCH55992.1 hypothetical protein DJ568_04385 [Mucilaginibacter hurinus]
MTIKILKTALCLTLSAFAINAHAQKKYSEGVVTLTVKAQGNNVETKTYFTADSNAYTFSMGPANLKLLSNSNADFFAVLVDVPVAGRKVAAVSTPAEIEEGLSKLPVFTFTPTTEKKVISNFNCNKVVAKEAKSGKSYDVWVTKDVSVPQGVLERYYSKIDGFPVQFTAFQMGRETEVTVTGVSDQKVPKGMFTISKDYTRVSMSDLAAMNGGN